MDVHSAAAAATASTLSEPKSNHRLRITIHFDGGSRGNPGVAGAGAQVVLSEEGRICDSDATNSITTNNNVVSENNIVKEYHVRKFCGTHATNNYAEYWGLLAGLEMAKLEIVRRCTTTTTSSSSSNENIQYPSFFL